jgi:hypothetical protein
MYFYFKIEKYKCLLFLNLILLLFLAHFRYSIRKTNSICFSNFVDIDTPLLQHQESRGDSRGGGRGNGRGESANTRIGSGIKVDLSNADDTPILEQRSINNFKSRFHNKNQRFF